MTTDWKIQQARQSAQYRIDTQSVNPNPPLFDMVNGKRVPRPAADIAADRAQRAEHNLAVRKAADKYYREYVSAIREVEAITDRAHDLQSVNRCRINIKGADRQTPPLCAYLSEKTKNVLAIATIAFPVLALILWAALAG